MKRTLLLMVALFLVGGATVHATKLYATYGEPANQGTWDSETHAYTWTASYSNLMTLFTFPNGELAHYTTLHLTTSDYDNQSYRVCFMNGGTAVATIAFWSGGVKDLNLAERSETKDVDLSKITHISFGGNSGGGSITLNQAYLEKPVAVEYDEKGIAVLDISDISYDSNLTFDDQTGEMTSNGQGTFSISLDSEDFSAVTKVELLHSGDDIVQTLQVTDAKNGVLGTFYSSKYVLDFANYQSKAGHVTKLSWNCNTAGTMTITGVRVTSGIITALNPHETMLTTAMFNDSYCEYHTGETLNQGATIYGNGSVVADKYADLAGYDELRLTGTPGQDVRLLFNWGTTKNEVIQTLDEDGYTAIDLTVLPAQQLNAFKFPWNGKTAVINSMTLYKKEVDSPYDYVLTGNGIQGASLTAALADESAKLYDATGVTGTGLSLTPANPNAIFVAQADVLTGDNVCVDGTIASLVLTDGHPFAFPAGATATNAEFARTMTTTYGTFCLPYAFSTAGLSVKVYTLGGLDLDNNTLTLEAQEGTVPAGTPVIVENTAGGQFSVAGAGALADVQAASGDLKLIGSFDNQTIDVTSEANYYAISGDQFVQALATITLGAFRAYFTAPASAPAKIRFATGEDATAIHELAGQGGATVEGIYSAGGVRQPSLRKGLNIVKLSNGKTQKVLVK